MAGLSNKDIAGVFKDIEVLMQVVGEDKRRASTYGRAAWMIEKLSESALDLAAAGCLTEVRGIGSSVEKVVMEVLATGTSSLRDSLAARTTPAVLEMLKIPGLGPKKLHTIVQELRVTDLASLRDAAADGSIAGLKGFGPKMAQNILDGLAYLDATRGRVRVDHAAALAASVIDKLAIADARIAGELRRATPIVGTIAIVARGDAAAIDVPGGKLDGDTWVLPRGTDPEVRIRFVDDYSWTAVGPGRGPLGDSAAWNELSGEYTTIIMRHMPGPSGTTRDGTLQFNDRLVWPITPFIGTLGVQPDRIVATSVDGQGPWGGNLDIRDTAPGNQILLPVYHEGARLYLGDVHASQGDTEFTGTAAETSATVRLAVDRIAGESRSYQRILKPDSIVAVHIARPMEAAVRAATIHMMEWLVADYGFSQADAYCFVSTCPDFRINVYQMCDIGALNFVVGAEVPNTFLNR